jgi:hypothetical protein
MHLQIWVDTAFFFIVKQTQDQVMSSRNRETGLETVDVHVLESYSQDVMYKDQGRTLATPVDNGNYSYNSI